MSENVQFDMDDQGVPKIRSVGSFAVGNVSGLGQSHIPGMAGWLVRRGIIKNEASAKGVLIAIVIADFVIAAAVLYFFVLKK